jgi:hypothetical protein
MATVEAKKKAMMRRGSVRPGEVRRGPAGEVEMIQFNAYRDNPLAPTALVSKIGGIYRLNTHLIRVTFIDEQPNALGDVEAVAQSHLIWKTAQHWLDTNELFRWAMGEFRHGTFHVKEGSAPRGGH